MFFDKSGFLLSYFIPMNSERSRNKLALWQIIKQKYSASQYTHAILPPADETDFALLEAKRSSSDQIFDCFFIPALR